MNLSTQWLPALPNGWQIANPKSLFSERIERSVPSDTHLTPSQKFGVLPQTEYMEISGGSVVLNLTGSENMKHVEKNDFIIHLRSFQGGIEYSNYSGKVSNAYCVLKPNQLLEPRFMKWVLKSQGYIQELNATTDQLRDGQSIKFHQFASIGLPLPPIEEQRRIADYLDSETRKIDALVEAKNNQIEQYLAVLDSKKNEIIWGNSKAELIPLRYLVKCNQRSLGKETSPDFKFSYCDVGSVNFRTGISSEIASVTYSEAPSRARRLAKEGDIVFSMVRPYLRAVAKVPQLDYQLVFSTAFAVLEPLGIAPEYLFEVLTTTRFLAETERWSSGMSYPAINQEELLKIKVPYLDSELQRERIANLTENHLSSLQLIRKIEDSVRALTEYKTSIITAAISGEFSKLTGRTVA